MGRSHIFISYTRKSEEHSRAVRRMGEKLRSLGYAVDLDQFYLEDHPEGPEEGWPAWRERSAREAPCVLIVASLEWFHNPQPGYPARSEWGVASESSYLQEALSHEIGTYQRVRLVYVDDHYLGDDPKVPDRLLKEAITLTDRKDGIEELIKWISLRLGRPPAEREAPHLKPDNLQTEALPRVRSSNLPLVFLSATQEDVGWRERIKEHLNKQKNQVEWWDDSRIPTGSLWPVYIDEAIKQAAVAVILLSPAYVESRTAIEECEKLVTRAEADGLLLFPIKLEECEWKTVFPKLRKFQVWDMEKPIGRFSEGSIRGELERIAEGIVNLALGLSGSDGDMPEQETTPLPPPDLTLSPTAMVVMQRARRLGRDTGRGNISSSCLLFALADCADHSVTGKFVYELLNRRGNLNDVRAEFLSDGGQAKWQGSERDEGLLKVVSGNVGRALRHARVLAATVSPNATAIQTRHLFAGLLLVFDEQVSGANGRLAKLDIEPAAMRREFREFLWFQVVGDDPFAWDEVLKIQAPSDGFATDIPSLTEKLTLDEQAVDFLAHVTGLATSINRPADSLTAVASLMRGAEGKAGFAASAMIEALRQGHVDGGSFEPTAADLLKLPSLASKVGLDWPSNAAVSGELVEVLKSTHEVVEELRETGYLRFRVLFAILLAKAPPFEYSAVRELRRLGYDLDMVRAHYRQFLADFRGGDLANIYDRLLGTLTDARSVLARGPVRSPVANSSPSPSTPQSPSTPPPATSGTRFNARRGATGDELCLNIDAYAEAIAETFRAASDESDFVFALYGPWGRGKSTQMQEVAKKLTGNAALREAERGYGAVSFSAWKYPSRPEVWVHLYQCLSHEAKGHDQLQGLRIAFRVGILKNGWWPLLWGFSLLALSRLPVLTYAQWLLNGIGFMGLLLIVTFLMRATSLGKMIAQRYFVVPDHGDKLGLQAVIGDDLRDLLRVWVRGKAPAPGSDAAALEESIDFRRGRRGFWMLTLLVSLVWIACGIFAWRVPEVEVGEIAGARVLTWAVLGLLALAVAVGAWLVSRPPRRHEMVLLVVDDLDRCEPDQMLAVIESLRLFLDDAEMSQRLQVVMLMDKPLLEGALSKRSRKRGLPRPVCDDPAHLRAQREKFFVAEMTLPALFENEVHDLAVSLVDREYRAQLEKERSAAESAANEAPPATVEVQEVVRQNPIRTRPDPLGSGTIMTGGGSVTETRKIPPKPEEIASHAARTEAARQLSEKLEGQISAVRPKSAPRPGAERAVVGGGTGTGTHTVTNTTFSNAEREMLKKVVAKTFDETATPRAIRAFVFRYQMARLLLQKMNRTYEPEDVAQVLVELLHRTPGAAPATVPEDIRWAVRHVV